MNNIRGQYIPVAHGTSGEGVLLESTLIVDNRVLSSFGGLLGMLAAVAISFSLFVFMAALIKIEDIPAPKNIIKIDTNFVMPKRTIPVVVNDDLPPIELPPQELIVNVEDHVPNDHGQPFNIVSVVKESSEEIVTQNSLPQLKPTFKALPVYPSVALRRGVEGYVEVAFNLSSSGAPINIQVIKAEPEKIFNRSAIKAVTKWRYDINERNTQERLVERLIYVIKR